MDSPISTLFIQFSLMSLMAFGGGASVIPEMFRLTTQTHPWLTQYEMASFLALSQAVPGPNVLVVTLIGWKVAGIWGAILSTVGMCGPSSVLTFFAGRVWDRFQHAPWRSRVLAGLNSITIGFIAASAYYLALSVESELKYVAVTLITTIGLSIWKLNPLWFIALGGMVGAIKFN